MKPVISVFLSAALLLAQVPAGAATDISAASAVVMDAESGRVIYQKDPHQRRLIASTTKLLTALVALEWGRDLQEVVTIDPAWAGVEGSSIYLRAGEEITLEALLYGMLLRSGNDAAVAVAGFCAGSVEAFVARMNQKAEQLGMKDSHFSNPNGLNAEDHYSTAYDMALLGRACLANETLAKMMATRSVTFGARVFTNHNKLLWQYEGCVGMKTGYTEKAGRTLISAARRDGLTLICVTLNDPNDWSDHTALLDEGFRGFQAQCAAAAGESVCRVPAQGSLLPFCPVTVEEDVTLCLSGDERVERQIILAQNCLQAPVQAGAPVGEVVFSAGGQELARAVLVTALEIPSHVAVRQNLLGRLWEKLTGAGRPAASENG